MRRKRQLKSGAIKRAYKFRFYPSPEQKVTLAQTFGASRFVYNYMLRKRTDAWFKEQKRIGFHESSAALPTLKQEPEYIWLNDISAVALQQSLQNLQTAFNNFFAKRTEYPTFKSKHGKQSATYVGTAFKWDGSDLSFAKMSGSLGIRWSRFIPKTAKVTTCTISKDTAGRYFVSMLCDDAVSPLPPTEDKIGIDLGLTHFVILSTGEKITSPKAFRKNEKKLAKLQRRMAHKRDKTTKNRAKAKLKVARLHAKIADTRKDFLHKLSTRLINENQVIAVETLAVSNMQKNHCLAKSIGDSGWSEFVRQLEYKAKWYGRTMIGIDRWYPSSKRCNYCGHIVANMGLKIRDWVCPECGVSHDRDINAARNVLTAGLAGLVCGENVSPVLL